MKKLDQHLVIRVLLAAALSGCFPRGGKYSPLEPAGFLSGVWHGWIAPFSLIVGIFNSDVRIYETFNTGWWYELGFYMAVISGFGGITLSRKRKKQFESHSGV